MIGVDPDGFHRAKAGSGHGGLRTAGAHGASDFSQTEVENFGMAALRDENIGGLDIAMNDVFGMRSVQGIGNFDGESQHVAHFHRLSANTVLQRDAVEKLHGDEAVAAFFADV